MPRSARSSSSVANGAIELAELLDVEVEVLVVRVVVRVVTCTNVTPCSSSRRASRQCRPKSCVP